MCFTEPRYKITHILQQPFALNPKIQIASVCTSSKNNFHCYADVRLLITTIIAKTICDYSQNRSSSDLLHTQLTYKCFLMQT